MAEPSELNQLSIVGHTVYEKGRWREFSSKNAACMIQTLDYRGANGKEEVVGVATAGEYDLGKTDHEKDFFVVRGKIIVRGDARTPANLRSIRFRKGETIAFTVEEGPPAVYLLIPT